MSLYGDKEGRKYDEMRLRLARATQEWEREELVEYCAFLARRLDVVREQLQELELELDVYKERLPASLTAILEYLGKSLELTEKGIKFSTKHPRGTLSKKTKYIRTLVNKHPGKSTKELYAVADKLIIGNIALRTFGNQVSIARGKKLK